MYFVFFFEQYYTSMLYLRQYKRTFSIMFLIIRRELNTMSEELLHEETQNEGTPVTMADLEEHFDDANPWNVVKSYMEKGTVLPVKVEGIVNGGAIAMVEGLRGFIPASRLSLSYIEDLETYLLKDIEVKVIDDFDFNIF